MIQYEDFELTEAQVNMVKHVHKHRAIRNYIKKYGKEPEDTSAFGRQGQVPVSFFHHPFHKK